MWKVILAFVAGLVMLPLCGWLYFRSAMRQSQLLRHRCRLRNAWLHMALNARIDKEAPKISPLQPSDDNYLAGAHVYRANCAICHGLPGQPNSPTAKGMYPRPPQLFKGKGVTDGPAGETYCKVANGIRLTGMPAYTGSLSETEMWQVSLLLANADKISTETRGVLQQPLRED
jgi:mono/diheme cytochrome c family protein